MFKKNEDIKKIFKKFEHLKNDDEYRMDETFEKHATIVMGTLDEIISNIDNVDYILDVLKVTGQTHVKIENFRQDFIMVSSQICWSDAQQCWSLSKVMVISQIVSIFIFHSKFSINFKLKLFFYGHNVLKCFI